MRILHGDDTPHRIALGVAVGVFVGFSPTMGIQTLIALALAAALRANKAVSIPMVWITNPVTFVPIYYFCWRLGATLMPGVDTGRSAEVLSRLEWASSSEAATGGGIFSYAFWVSTFELMLELGAELWIGCTLVGLLAGGTVYLVTKWTVRGHRLRRAQKRIRATGNERGGMSRKPVVPATDAA